jgi:hypothetical protein
VECNGRVLILCTIEEFAWESEENHKKTYSNILAEITTGYLPCNNSF